MDKIEHTKKGATSAIQCGDEGEFACRACYDEVTEGQLDAKEAADFIEAMIYDQQYEG